MTPPKDKETILYAFSVEPNHDRRTLERYLGQYPELSEELIDLAAELRLVESQTCGVVAPIDDPGLQSAWQQFIACGAAPERAKGPQSFLAKFRGQAFADLATRLRIPRSFLTAFRDKLVEPSTVPEHFLARFAVATESSVQAILDYLAGPPPQVIGTTEFKADKKPAHQGRASFRQLVESTPMTDEERTVLLGECDADGRKRG